MAFQSFLVTLLLLFLQLKCLLSQEDCRWDIALTKLDNFENEMKFFIDQAEVQNVSEVFKQLEDSPIDPDDRDARYYGFPYYLKIKLICLTQNKEEAIRSAHYSGLQPVLTITFGQPVNARDERRQKLEIVMPGAPYKFQAGCASETVCDMCWYTPMPFIKRSVMMWVSVKSNGIGIPVKDKKFSINVNGYVQMAHGKVKHKLGTQISDLRDVMSTTYGSRPLWYTHEKTPVLILGGFPRMKVVLISDTSFEDFVALEVGIDSCWIGSLSCPQKNFSSSIMDAIATESTLFIRQNQLIYYFTGHYSILDQETNGSELWTRILNKVCVKKLNPTFIPRNGSEFVIALGGGSQEGEFFLITCKDGVVTASGSLKQGTMTVCNYLKLAKCSIEWAVMNRILDDIVLLVNDLGTGKHFIVLYHLATKSFDLTYNIPFFVPDAGHKEYMMLLGTEQYTTTRLIPRGLSFNPNSGAFYIWGNVLLQSYDMRRYVYFSKFPASKFIKHFVLSFLGHVTFGTDNDEFWISHESGMQVKQFYPSDSYKTLVNVRGMRQSRHFSRVVKQSIISIFYEMEVLYVLLYQELANGRHVVIKRRAPIHDILTYDLMISNPAKMMTHNALPYIRFTHRCPFGEMRFVDLPKPQSFTRMEHYHLAPPEIMEKTGFHSEKSLEIYQGLVYQLLHLHSAYRRPYADPVHDPTWRWWKDKKEEEQYYNYMASNWKSSGGISVNMAEYGKFSHVIPRNMVPTVIHLDKNTAYTFSIYLSRRTGKEAMGETAEENSLGNIWLTVHLGYPEFIQANLQRQELISRAAVLYQVSIQDKGKYPYQRLSGRGLLSSLVTLQVMRSDMVCYEYADWGFQLKGTESLLVNIGCPPGKRLAFDITYTKNYTTEKNKRYFDCVEEDPEMPCFYFGDVFYPFFLVQDMVTGYSGRFYGSYSFSVIGGGAFEEKNVELFTPDQIRQFNVESKNGTGLIWIRVDGAENQTNSEGLPVFSEANSGIMWLCQEGSPCYDIVPRGLVAPHYFFKIKVSNRGIDQTTYCDYDLEFTIHVHGLRLSASRSIYFLKISFTVVIMLVILYIVIQLIAAKVQLFCRQTLQKLKTNVAMRAESSLTFTSSLSEGSLQPMPSEVSQISSQTPSNK